MQFEAFRGRDVATALAQVRSAFGSNAVIGSTRVISNGKNGAFSQSYVEVTAAPGDAAPSQAGPFSRDIVRADGGSRPAPSRRPALPSTTMAHAGSGAHPLGHAADASMGAELRTLRALVEEMAAIQKPKDRALAMLTAVGIEGAVARELSAKPARATKGGTKDVRSQLRARLKERFHVLPNPIDQPGRRLIACVGPTGVGKTTTIAKLAARAALEGGRSVSIVTLDTFRVGAVEQIRRFCQLIGVPLDSAHDAKSFNAVIAPCPDDIVLVDTPSRGGADEASLKRLIECLGTVTGRTSDILLTLPASLRARDAEAIAALYAPCGTTGLCVTKLDETEHVGGAFYPALAGMPVAFTSGGPRVPEDLCEASPEELAELVLPGEG